MCLQVHMHIHIRIFNSTNRLNMIQPKALRHLPEIRSGHRVQKPRHHLLNGTGLLLRQFVNHGRLGYTLDVDVLGGLPGTVVGVVGVGGCGEVGVAQAGGEGSDCGCLLEKGFGCGAMASLEGR